MQAEQFELRFIEAPTASYDLFDMMLNESIVEPVHL
jgi:hypothetical protein